MRKTCQSLAGFLLLAVMLLALTACQPDQTKQPDQLPPPPPPVEDTTVELKLIAAGDNLIHGPIYRQAKERTGGSGFDFTAAYQPIAAYIAAADLAFINQETPLGGTELGLHSYPMFNSPQELGTHLVDMGFNLISHANNHILDAGQKGFFNTISFWRSQPGVIMAGVAADSTDDTIRTLDRQGITIALLAYTYGANGLSLPSSSTGVIKYIDDELICQELAAARELADIVIVSMHWGVEYQDEPNAEQKRLAQLIADNGADVIIGTHPHVLQTAATLQSADDRQVPVFYSLGNLISAQNKPETMLGALAEIDLTYDTADGSITYDDIEVIPVVNHFTGNYQNITVYPLAEYTAEQAAEHGVSGISLDYLNSLFAERIPEKYRADTQPQ